MMRSKKTHPVRLDRETVRDAGQIMTSNEVPNPEVQAEFNSAQRQTDPEASRIEEAGASSDAQSPELTDGALDAAWDGSDVDEESRDGSAPSPDQNAVDELGEQAGLTFRDDESIDAPGKLGRRDRDRWELEPASAEDFGERQLEPPTKPKRPGSGL